jgi:hypothetical protein
VIVSRYRHQQAIEVQQGVSTRASPLRRDPQIKRIIRAVPATDTSPPALVLHKTSTWHAVFARLTRRLQAWLLTQPVGGISTAGYATKPWPPSLASLDQHRWGSVGVDRPSNSYWKYLDGHLGARP